MQYILLCIGNDSQSKMATVVWRLGKEWQLPIGTMEVWNLNCENTSFFEAMVPPLPLFSTSNFFTAPLTSLCLKAEIGW